MPSNVCKDFYTKISTNWKCWQKTEKLLDEYFMILSRTTPSITQCKARLQAVLTILKRACCWMVFPGGDYTEMGLAATTVASSFGKVIFLIDTVRECCCSKTQICLDKFVVLRQWLVSIQSGFHLNITIKIFVFD